MLSRFSTYIHRDFSFLLEKKLLLACSGGLDSVVLLHLCVALELDICVAHCNFNLREVESDGDEAFVLGLSKKLKVPVKVKSFDTQEYMALNKVSIQMAARELRYQWFNQLVLEEGFDYILTAHHADDSLETFIINLSRGTGLEGLTGIPIQNGLVVRPLLDFSRNDILTYAKAERIAWREDSSNTENKYLRNKIRQDIVPRLKELHPAFLDNFQSSQSHLRATKALLQAHIDELRKKLLERHGNHYKLNVASLLQLHPVEPHLYYLLKDYGFSEWNDVKGLLTAMSGKQVESKTHRLLKDREYLVLFEKEVKNRVVFDVAETTECMDYPISLKFEPAKTLEILSENVVFLDKEKLNYPLILRNWEKGDYFYPFGLKGKKKLSKFFKDEKMDVFSKEKQWLLCSGEDIVWVVGRRLDDRYRVGRTTKQIIKITFSA